MGDRPGRRARAAWNLVTSSGGEEARTFNLVEHIPTLTAQTGRAREFVEVVKGRQNSWEDEAFLWDKVSGSRRRGGRRDRSRPQAR
ncbi:hypothetical protein [Xanthobacter aminoxidans]|uniref:hypothetical protein n=1 Tax=Xanthobacter aminoxidans TaxID=186280 RepID=UPI002023072D|nr:hypothetical protein [Xanthobacter aminoxidans]MCL8384231.1 hypothetical protein [Xanthobacter aminoxidans]